MLLALRSIVHSAPWAHGALPASSTPTKRAHTCTGSRRNAGSMSKDAFKAKLAAYAKN